MSNSRCAITELTLGRTLRALRLENDLLATTVLLDKGADIYELIYKPRGMDVMWKSRMGLPEPSPRWATPGDSNAQWIEAYEGGSQVLFPNGGNACQYKGVELNFHGEASLAAWDMRVVEASDKAAEVLLSASLRRSPFRIERSMRVEAGRPVLFVRETVTNESAETLDYMWGHHPAYGAPFLSGDCRVYTGARRIQMDDGFDGRHNPATPDGRFEWPWVRRGEASTDLSRVPGEEAHRHILGYLNDFESGWYAITNTKLGFGVGLAWPVEAFPYAWFWQEMHASPGFPWYANVYVMAIEPFSSYPAQGLATVMAKTQTHRSLAAGKSASIEFEAVFYEATAGVARIERGGEVKSV